MKAYEFPSKVVQGGKLELPEELQKVFAENQEVRVLVLVQETSDQAEPEAWSRLTAEQFLAGYSEADAAYDKV
jgi:hypothetical protein